MLLYYYISSSFLLFVLNIVLEHGKIKRLKDRRNACSVSLRECFAFFD